MGKYYSGIEFQYLELLPVLYLGGEYIYRLCQREILNQNKNRMQTLLKLMQSMFYRWSEILKKTYFSSNSVQTEKMMTGRLTKTILSSQLLDSIQSEYFWGLHIHLQFKFGAQTLKPSITFDWVVEHNHPPPQYEQKLFLVKAMMILLDF